MNMLAIAPVLGRKTVHNTYRYAAGLATILIQGAETGGAFALMEAMQKPGGEPPLHIHDREDETFYVLEGEIAVWVGGQVHHLKPGDSVFLPRGVPHTFRVKSPVARGLNFMTPAGFEEYFQTLGKPTGNFDLPETVLPPTEEELAAIQRLADKLGVRIIGPAPAVLSLTYGAPAGQAQPGHPS